MSTMSQTAQLKAYDNLVELIYDSALDPSQWSVFIEKLTTLTHCTSGVFWQFNYANRQDDFFYSHELDPAPAKDYAEYYVDIDTYSHYLLKQDAGKVLLMQDFMSDEEKRKTEFYQDFLRPQGIDYVLGSHVVHHGSNFTSLNLIRSECVGPIGRETVKLVERILPHMMKAHRVHKQLAVTNLQANLTEELFNRLQAGVVMVDKAGKPVYMNNKANFLLDQNKGLSVKQGKLSASTPRETNKLQELIARASVPPSLGSNPSDALMLSASEQQQPLSVLVTPVTEWVSSNVTDVPHVSALVFVSELNQQTELSPDILRSLYGFTRAEARLVIELINGLPIEQISEKYHLSQNTLRAQMKSVFKKVNVNRQVDLVKVILSGPVRFSLQCAEHNLPI